MLFRSTVRALIENTGPFSSAGLRIKTPASGSDWYLEAKETGGGTADGFFINHPTLGTTFSIKADTANVGIGTSAPSEKLEVSGNVKAASFIGSGSGLTNLNAVAKSGDTMTGKLNLPAYGVRVGTSQFVVSTNPPENGSLGVGIGTANPQATLHVADFLNGRTVRAWIQNTGPYSTAGLRLTTPATSSDWYLEAKETGAGLADGFFINNPTFGTTFCIKGNTANVGIGTSTPGNKLSVAGSADFSGTVYGASFSGSGAGLSAVPVGGLQSGGAATGQVLTWTGSAWSPANPAPGNGSLVTSLSSSNASFTSVTDVDVTNMEVTITTGGRPVMIVLIPDGSTNNAYVRGFDSDTAAVEIYLALKRDSQLVGRTAIHSGGSGLTSADIRVPSSSVSFIDVPPAGTHTYILSGSIQSSGGRTGYVVYSKLAAFEL